jgi:twitching motility protein PilU
MEQGIREGCQSFDQALFVLYQERRISLEEALSNADSANNLRLKIKMAGLSVDEATNGSQEEPKPEDVEGLTPEIQEGSGLFRLQNS